MRGVGFCASPRPSSVGCADTFPPRGRQVCVAASRMRRGRAAIKKTERCCSVFFNCQAPAASAILPLRVNSFCRSLPCAAGRFCLSAAAFRRGTIFCRLPLSPPQVILFVGRRYPSAAGQFFLSGPPHCGRRAAIISLAAFTPSTRAMTSVRSTGLP